MSDIIVRKMLKRDFGALAEISALPDVQTLTLFVKAAERGESALEVFQKLRQVHDNGWHQSFVIERDAQVVGYMSRTATPAKPDVYWLGGFLHADARRQGVSSAARLALMDMTRKTYEKRYKKLRPIFRVQVRHDNLPALAMVQKLAFFETDAPAQSVAAVTPMRHFVRI